MPSKAKSTSSKTKTSSPNVTVEGVRLDAIRIAMNLPDINRDSNRILAVAKQITDFVLDGK